MSTALKGPLQATIVAAALLVAAAFPAVAADPAAADVTVEAPPAGGVIKADSVVPFQLVAPSCDGLSTRVVFVDADSGAAVSEAPVSGCAGAAAAPALPSEFDGQPVSAALVVAHDGEEVVRHPLNLRRKQAPHADSMNRDIPAEPTTDPRGGGSHLGPLQPGDAISFAGIDVTNIHSVSFRIAAGSNGARLELREGAEDGPLIGSVDTGNTGGWDEWLSVSVEIDPADVPEGPAELFVVATDPPYEPLTWPWEPPHPRDLPALCESPVVSGTDPCVNRDLVNLNHVDLNGHGVTEPYEFPPDDPGFESIFDGTSLDGWRMAGPGGFHLTEDGAACSEGGMGLLWYEPETYADFTLRTEFTVSTWRDNSGVFVRFPDPGDDPWVAVDEGYEAPQIDDSFPSYQRTGSVYTFSAAEPLETHAIGEWNALEVTVVGHHYRVAINGREVTTYEGNRGLEGHVGLQNNDYFEGSQVCFRDVRVKDL